MDTSDTTEPIMRPKPKRVNMPEHSPPVFRQIGKGNCGSVWAPDRGSEASALKRGDGSLTRCVRNDSVMHQQIESSVKAAQSIAGDNFTHLNIPQHRAFVDIDEGGWWKRRMRRFEDDLEHCNTLITERILPFGRPVRERLIESFCPEKSREQVKSNRKDDDCLIRPYLGRKTHNRRPSPFFTLRNKPLHVDQLKVHRLPMEEYARTMADALTIMHWHAKVDANDVEFVLAPTRSNETDTWESPFLGRHTMWILDFDLVRPITLDEEGVEQAVKAFYGNDPYFPCPGKNDEDIKGLWKVFSERFLESSKVILGGESQLPQMFIDRLEQIGEERKRQD